MGAEVGCSAQHLFSASQAEKIQLEIMGTVSYHVSGYRAGRWVIDPYFPTAQN